MPLAAQGCVLQSCAWVLSDGQPTPPYCGWTNTMRDEICQPPPQGFEQVPKHFQSLTTQSMGQGCTLHCCVSESVLGSHGLALQPGVPAPCAGSSTLRVRVRWPPPHGLLQSVQVLHGPASQSRHLGQSWYLTKGGHDLPMPNGATEMVRVATCLMPSWHTAGTHGPGAPAGTTQSETTQSRGHGWMLGPGQVRVVTGQLAFDTEAAHVTVRVCVGAGLCGHGEPSAGMLSGQGKQLAEQSDHGLTVQSPQLLPSMVALQHCVLHSTVWMRGGHTWPPHLGSTSTERVCVDMPPPHLAVHCVGIDQSETWQSTGQH